MLTLLLAFHFQPNILLILKEINQIIYNISLEHSFYIKESNIFFRNTLKLRAK